MMSWYAHDLTINRTSVEEFKWTTTSVENPEVIILT